MNSPKTPRFTASLIPRSHLSIRLTGGSFTLVSLTITLCVRIHFFPTCTTRHTHRIILYFIFGDENELWSSLLCSFLKTLVSRLSSNLPSVQKKNFDTHKNNKENNICGFHSLLSQTVHSKIKYTGPNGKKNSSKLNCLPFLYEYKFNFLAFSQNISKLPHISRMC